MSPDLRRPSATTPSSPPTAPGFDGTAALALPLAAPSARTLQAVNSRDEQRTVEQFAARITGAATEVLAGKRPVQQLARWLPRDLLAGLQLRALLSSTESTSPGSRAVRAHRAASVTSVRASMVQPGTYEAVVVVSDRLRSRAVALRLERVSDGGWGVTALEIG